MFKKESAQSILEYIIVLSAIIVAVIAATGQGGVLQKAITKLFNDSSQVIEDQSDNFLSRVGGGNTTAPGEGG